MPLVLDASVAMCWAMRDERDPLATAAAARAISDDVLVPALWWFELRNSLVVAERRSRIAVAETAMFLANLDAFAITIDRTPDNNSVLRLARERRLTVYDAAYLELAIREGAVLATLDTALMRAARAEGVSLIDGED